MIKNVYDYFEDLEKKKLPRNDQKITFDSRKNSKNNQIFNLYPDNCLTLPISINGIKYYTKEANPIRSTVDIASTNMYNSIGMPTPPIYLVEKYDNHQNKSIPMLFTASQDVNSVKEYEFSLARNLLDLPDIKKLSFYSTLKWFPLYSDEVQNVLLNHMTRECFDQLISLFLLDELRTEKDRHEFNYFFYKTKDSEKYEGIMPIDNELTALLMHTVHKDHNFNTFLNSPYPTPTVLGDRIPDINNYSDRINDIKKLLYEQRLTQQQIELMKKSLQYDFPNEIKTIGNIMYPVNNLKNINNDSTQIKNQRSIILAYDNFSKLWDYLNNKLGKELEM